MTTKLPEIADAEAPQALRLRDLLGEALDGRDSQKRFLAVTRQKAADADVEVRKEEERLSRMEGRVYEARRWAKELGILPPGWDVD